MGCAHDFPWFSVACVPRIRRAIYFRRVLGRPSQWLHAFRQCGELTLQRLHDTIPPALGHLGRHRVREDFLATRLDAVEAGDHDIFPDPVSAEVAEGWRNSEDVVVT